MTAPPPDPDPDAPLRRRLARHRAVATGLVAAMALAAIGGSVLPAGFWPDLLRAASRAGFIGGIADWFAVTALFRRPLGLPIPHTAVIPRQRRRLGRALGQFLASHVFTEDEIARLVARLDLPGEIARALADDATRRRLSGSIARALPFLLEAGREGRAGRAFADFLPALVDQEEVGRIVARALRTFVEGGRHQAVVSLVVTQLRTMLGAKESGIRAMIEERVREQGGRLVGWALGGSIANRVLAAITKELDDADPDGSEMREAVTAWIETQIALIEREPARAGALGQAIRRVVGQQAIGAWGSDVWARLRGLVDRDAARPDGHLANLADEALARLAARLAADAPMRARLDAAIAHAVGRALPTARVRMAEFIELVVAGWDDRMIVDKLELRVGRDLQYIRINGTLVGFFVGALVQLVLR